MTTIADFWNEYIVFSNRIEGYRAPIPAIKLLSGLTMSVQAGKGLYSTPREYTGNGKAYTAWEIGFPSETVEELLPYIEDESNPTNTVYGYVPTETVNAIIEKHGGIVGPA